MIHQLKQAGTFTNIGKMEAVLTAVSTNIVVDKGLNLIELAQQATAITAGHISFTTLPITGFGTAPNGESINTVNVGQVQTTVQELLPPAPKAAATSKKVRPRLTPPRPRHLAHRQRQQPQKLQPTLPPLTPIERARCRAAPFPALSKGPGAMA
ncbi:anionic cell wall polymer biosynthesis LytR-Cps2A-Psr (LCP) family protein [Arthrobacter sp. UYCu511]|uniref:hypothetical protein n=1 Tax=Arthrobacter sp. UYCu511 TaxID=3156337 RepID=UPI0033978CC2